MRLTIATRLFLALTLVSVVIVTLNAAITRWNFERGFLDYVAKQETDTLNDVAARLADTYRTTGSWASLQGNPRRWNELMRPQSAQPRPERGPPPPDPLALSRRTALLDTDGNTIAGRPGAQTDGKSMPITLDGQTIGFITIAPQQRLTNQLDQEFAKKQKRSIYVIAVAALLFAATFSALLARQLTRPIRTLASGARAITAGDFDTRIRVANADELGDLANDFNKLAETLQKNRLSRQRWVADIAHELRTPLAILRGELDAIEDNVRTFDASTRKSLQAEIIRLSKLVDDLHDLSVHDEGAPRYQTENVDVVALLRAVLDNSKNRFRDAGIELAQELPPQGVDVLGDKTRLEQLFTNLLSNTLRYTDSPGLLRVTGSLDADAVAFEFADSAPGVPDKMLPQLFDRLFRVSASRSRDSGGSGLGLSICKAIVAAHGGKIEAMKSTTGGLLIRVQLPLSPNARVSA